MICDVPEDPKDGPLYAIGIFMISAAIGAICSFFIKEELRRLKPKTMTDQGTFDSNGQLIDTDGSLANAF